MTEPLTHEEREALAVVLLRGYYGIDWPTKTEQFADGKHFLPAGDAAAAWFAARLEATTAELRAERDGWAAKCEAAWKQGDADAMRILELRHEAEAQVSALRADLTARLASAWREGWAAAQGSALTAPYDEDNPYITAQLAMPCRQCGPGYRIGDDGCRHTAQPDEGGADA